MPCRMKRLQDRQAALTAEMRSLLDKTETESNRELTEEETAAYDAHEKELTELEPELARELRLQEREKTLARPVRDINEDTDDAAADRQRSFAEPKTEPEKFGTLGEFAVAVYEAGLPGGRFDRRLLTGAATGMNEAIGSQGGFLVQTDLVEGLLLRVHETSKIWNRCRNIPISSNANGVKINAIRETSRVAGSRWGGIRAYWAAEAGEKTASKPELRQIELNLRKLIGLCYATDELLQDASALQAVLEQGFVEEFGFQLDDAVINGTGTTHPLGILNSPCIVSVGEETGQAATTLVAENIEKMYARMWAPSVANAVWLINQNLWPQIFKFQHAVGTGGVPMFIPAGGLTETPNGTLLGRPIVPIEQCQTLGTTGDIYFADFTQYVTATKGGIDKASSIHLKFNYDETCYRWVFRADGQPIWSAPLTPFKGGAGSTVSPFIKLDAR